MVAEWVLVAFAAAALATTVTAAVLAAAFTAAALVAALAATVTVTADLAEGAADTVVEVVEVKVVAVEVVVVEVVKVAVEAALKFEALDFEAAANAACEAVSSSWAEPERVTTATTTSARAPAESIIAPTLRSVYPLALRSVTGFGGSAAPGEMER